jgi:hypothetical protein
MNTEFLAGVAVRDITPDPRIVDNSLHCTMTVRFDKRGSPLLAKALALSFQRGTRLLVALDLAYMRTPAAAVTREAIAEATGVEFDDVVLSCSHSHSTPFVEPLDGPHPFLDLIIRQSVDAAVEALSRRRPARLGHGVTYAVGGSFNNGVPLPDGRMKFSRDFREGLATGRPVDPRLNVIRIDDEHGKPIAGWVRFAAHPANVIFNASVSAEYPGYMAERLSEVVDGSPPILFGYGASGDVNCIPMFGSENESRNLGHRLADIAAAAFASIETRPPRRMLSGAADVELPLDEPPSVETLDREIEEVDHFIAALEHDPDLVWVLGFNCDSHWSIEQKRASARPLVEWARLVKERVAAGERFPKLWTRRVTAWVIDDLGLVFDQGETLTEISLALGAQSPLGETLLMSLANGADGYLGTDADRRRGGYRTYLSQRYDLLAEGGRPMPYALGAAQCYLDQILGLLGSLVDTAAAPATSG